MASAAANARKLDSALIDRFLSEKAIAGEKSPPNDKMVPAVPSMAM